MSLRREPLLLCVIVVLICLVFAGLTSHAGGQASVVPPQQVGRYRLSTNSSNTVYIIDTVTGNTWYRDGSNVHWQKLPALPLNKP